MNELKIIEFKNQRVLTTQQLAESYGTTNKVISNNFNNNKERYEEGKHFLCVKGEELKEFKSNSLNLGIAPNLNVLYLWTERGAFLHAKSLNTDKAWEVYDSLVEHYFKTQVKALPTSYKEALIQLVAQVEENEKLQLENKEMQPKAEFYDDVTGSRDTVEMATVSKVLNIKGMGRNNLFQFLREQKILQGDNQPYQTYVDRGYFRVVISKWNTPNGDIHTNYKTIVYPKGIDFIRRKLKENGYS